MRAVHRAWTDASVLITTQHRSVVRGVLMRDAPLFNVLAVAVALAVLGPLVDARVVRLTSLIGGIALSMIAVGSIARRVVDEDGFLLLKLTLGTLYGSSLLYLLIEFHELLTDLLPVFLGGTIAWFYRTKVRDRLPKLGMALRVVAAIMVLLLAVTGMIVSVVYAPDIDRFVQEVVWSLTDRR